MYCLECHDTYPDTARFCSTCGQRLCADPPTSLHPPPLPAEPLEAGPSIAGDPQPTEILAPWIQQEDDRHVTSGNIAFFEGPAVAWGQCSASAADCPSFASDAAPPAAGDEGRLTFTCEADDIGVWTADSLNEPETDYPSAEESWLPTVALPEPAWEPGLALCVSDVPDSMDEPGTVDAAASGAPMLESWWVPSAPQWTNHSAPPAAAFEARAVSNPALSIAASGGQPVAIESWWVPQGNVALAVAEPPPGPSLTLVSRGVPEPQSNIVWQHEAPPDQTVFEETAPVDDGQLEASHSTADGADPADASAEESLPATLADPGHLNSSWLGPEIDPPDPSSLPQPWWIPKSDVNDLHEVEGEDEHDPVEAASLWTTPTVAAPLVHEQPAPPAKPAPLPAEPPTAADARSGGTDTAAAAAPARSESHPSRGRVIHPRSSAPAAGRQKRKVEVPSVRPAFLLAAVVAIILGGFYIWLSAAFESPVAGRLPDPLPANPLVQDVGVPTPLPLPSETMATAPAPPITTSPEPVAPPVKSVTPAAPARRVPGRTTPAKTTKPIAQAAPARTAEPPVKAEPAAQHLPASSLPTQTVMAAPPAQASPVPQVEVASGQVFEASSVDIKPAIASQVEPRYPEEVSDQRDDVVVLRVLVTPNGRTADTQVLRKSKVHPLLDAAAVRAVQQWTFSPALKRDRPVACWINVGVPFRATRDVASR